MVKAACILGVVWNYMEIVPFGGWEHCARIISGDAEALVTLDVGPRIIRLGFIGERNELHENPEDMGKRGGEKYRSYGGHRLWIAPEDTVRTYQPENGSVRQSEHDGWCEFSIPADQFGMEKTLRIRPEGEGQFRLEHSISNRGAETVSMAPWGITQMTTGGVCLFPQCPYQAFPAQLIPARPMALWTYTDMSDPRFVWGRDVVQLKQDVNLGPIKVGTFVSQGYAGYLNGQSLFVKSFGADGTKAYPDFGCNFETFTREDMLEIESLGYLRDLAPGDEAYLTEYWCLARVENGESPSAELLERYAQSVQA